MKDIKDIDVLKIVVVGHVDHGKSTVIGRLLYDTNSLPEGTVNKVKKIAKDTGKPFEYAYLLDAFEEEQKQGITIDTTQIQFKTEKRDYVIIDAPGHKEFLKNMISGAANAQAAFLVIDAKEGVQEQSKRHAYILSLLGIKKVYIIVNKMDLIDYSESAFNKVKEDMTLFLNDLKVFPIGYIPVSGYYGENILTASKELPWYKGYSVIEAMDHIEKEKSLEDKPLRFPIQDVYKFDDRRIIAGRLESGRLKVGDPIYIYPEGKTTHVKSIESWGRSEPKTEVLAGESIGITVEDEFFNKRGEIISSLETKPHISNAFRASVFWMGKNPLEANKKYKIKIATQEIEGEIESILKVIDTTSLDNSESKGKVFQNDVAEVIIKTQEAIAFDAFGDFQASGRFVIVDGYDVAGGGIVVASEKARENKGWETFKKGDLRGRGDIFEEFYYNIEEKLISKTGIGSQTYTIGDEIPTRGKSYSYPENFDILILRDNIAVGIRHKKVDFIIPLSDYQYGGYPITNGRGFLIHAKSNEDVNLFFKEYSQVDERSEVDFLNKWMLYGKYRQVIFHNADWII